MMVATRSEPGIAEIRNQNGQALLVAVGPVARLEWIEQVASNRQLTNSKIRLAIALSSFVNSQDGYAFPGQKALGEKSGLAERQVREHLADLMQRGYVFQKRRHHAPACLYLVLLNRRENLRLSDPVNRRENRLSKAVNRQFTSRSDEANVIGQPADFEQVNRRILYKSTGSRHFLNGANSNTCDGETLRPNQVINSGAEKAAILTDDDGDFAPSDWEDGDADIDHPF
jgi:hypothetical protein